MYAYPTEAYTHDACESEHKYNELCNGNVLKAAIDSYGIGMRTTEVLRTLAYARVWSRNIGVVIWPPDTVATQSEWNAILDKLVWERLGAYRCLDCGNFHHGQAANPDRMMSWDRCSQCGGPSEVLGGLVHYGR